MPVSSEVVCLNVSHSIERGELATHIDFPENFFSQKEMVQVQLLSGLIDTLNNVEFSAGGMKSLEDSHNELAKECAIIFPFGSQYTFDISNLSEESALIPLEVSHDDKIDSLHSRHQMVLVDSIIKVLKNMAIMVIRKSNRK